MSYVYNDGGRAASGYKGTCGDCGVRAFAIAEGLDYKQAYKQFAQANKGFGFAKSARNGLHKQVFWHVLKCYGYKWSSAPQFSGRKAKCRDLNGKVIARQAHHYVAVIDGEPHDIWDSSQKMVYGYWYKA
tara:strand:- start:1976 stop:2365 length:390 start_codon:yes stop_codon:yes gene_type:complete